MQPSAESAEAFLSHTLLLDLEIAPGAEKYGALELGAACGDWSVRRHIERSPAEVLEEVIAACPGTRAVMGHNLLGHDLPILRQRSPSAALLRLPVVDTLYLSALAFPRNPYHHLLKGYKLSRKVANDPVADARLSAQLFCDEWRKLTDREREHPGPLSLYRFCFQQASPLLQDHGGLALSLAGMGGSELDAGGASAVFRNLVADRACIEATRRIWNQLDNLPEDQRQQRILAIAYAAAWIPEAGGNSVIPQWVWREVADVAELIRLLREAPCAETTCSYCRNAHDPLVQLQRWFGFESFRDKPADRAGRSLQAQIVAHGMRGGSHLAVLPTGGGKSLCFQLPALSRNFRRGSLTIVISPLQALMRDQVENLKKNTGARGAALYGLLTSLERGRVLREIAMGDISLLYIAPEQLRNRTFRSAVLQREIGAWVFDEAHCLSKWGHDFRPDYLYACRAISEIASAQRRECPPVACLTATAKKDVAAEITAHFKAELGIGLEVFAAGVQRDNLDYRVEEVAGARKPQRILDLCAESLESAGSVIVYHRTRKATERASDFLRDRGLSAAHFHGGLNAAVKKETLDRFLQNDLRVICATNAFGMGVDKPDVRLVVHADIPGTLENYLQESGRAGRDQQPALCVLLFDEADVEDQFRLIKDSELSRADMAQVLRGLRRAGRRGDGAEFQITSGELLRDDGVETSFEAGEHGADTKVRTAVSWLERAELVQRNLNQTTVFGGKPKVRSLDVAGERLDLLKISGLRREMWLQMLDAMLQLDPDEGLTVDELAGLPAFQQWRKLQPRDSRPHERISPLILGQLREMTLAGLVQEGTRLSAFLRHGIKDSSEQILARTCALEMELLAIMQEQSPDAESGDALLVSLRQLNQELKGRGHRSHVEAVRSVLQSLSADRDNGTRLTVRPRNRFQLRARLSGSWSDLAERVRDRQAVAEVCLRFLLSRVPDGARPSAEQLVEFSLESLIDAVRGDLSVRTLLDQNPLALIERALLYLHDQRAIILQRGLAIFRAAMSIRLVPDAGRRRYSKADYEPLREHYVQRTVQVHVMRRYAELGISDHAAARDLVDGYFAMTNRTFLKRFFRDDLEAIRRPISASAYRKIVDELRNPVQQAIVTAPAEQNQLVLAGPGSGKTRVVVHRCAYLLRVLRVRRSGVLVLCFNRATALEIRRRLRQLLGGRLAGLQVHTYDGLAMRIAGHSQTDPAAEEKPDFAAIRQQATELLTGARDAGALQPDELRDRLLSGYRHILVDEYQDIDESQYQLVSAIAGRTQTDKDARLAILAVGDDDQNIYSWRGSSTEFIRRFREDYGAKPYRLLENYRSTARIVKACNQLIGHNRHRMKQEPIRVSKGREDPGREVCLIPVTGSGHQTEVLAAELAAMRDRHSGRGWNEVALLAREWKYLEPLRLRCRDLSIPVRWAGEQTVPAWRVRETRQLLAQLTDLPREQKSIGSKDLRIALSHVVDACGSNQWTTYLRQIVDLFEEEHGGERLPARAFLEFMMELMVEERQLAMAEEGVFLGTLHAAKGLEFDTVFLLDGGWKQARGEDGEARRRLFYVGMTRARKELTLLATPSHPFAREIPGLKLRRPQMANAVRESGPTRQIQRFTLSDYFLDFAGRKPSVHPVHEALRALNTGDRLELQAHKDRVFLHALGSKLPLAALSADASAAWRDQQIEEMRILALIERCRDDSHGDFRQECFVERWEIPLVEVTHTVPGTAVPPPSRTLPRDVEELPGLDD